MRIQKALLLLACIIVVRSKYIQTTKPRYGGFDDPVIVKWENIDDNYWNWISIVPAGRPDDFKELGRFQYTQGQTSGEHTFAPFQYGDYEARIYFKWPHGGYQVQQRVAFVVGDCEHGCSKCHQGSCQRAEQGFFVDTQNGYKPKPCDPSCRTCNGASDYRCTSCQNGYTLREFKCERLNKYYFSQLKNLKDEKCPVLFTECGFKGDMFQACQETQNFGTELGSVFVPSGWDRFVKVSGTTNLFDGREVVFSKSVDCIDQEDVNFLRVNGMHLVSTKVKKIVKNKKKSSQKHKHHRK